MTRETAADFIIFATNQARGAQEFGFTRNECCRNLKIALHQYWQNKILKQHGQIHRDSIPRSKEAQSSDRSQWIVEHAVPHMELVNRLMDMQRPLERGRVIDLLDRLFRVVVVTKEEHERLNTRELRFRMPDDWDGEDPFARYAKVDIEIVQDTA